MSDLLDIGNGNFVAIDYIDNGILKVGIIPEWGTVVGWLSPSGVTSVYPPSQASEYIIYARTNDGGIQASYWGDPLGSNSEWPWDPIQGGSYNELYYGHPVVEAYSLTETGSYSRVRPVQFIDMNGDSNPYMVIEQWVELIGNAVKIRHRAVYTGPDRTGRQNEFPDETAGVLYGINGFWNQESPALSINSIFYDLYGYLGDSPWTNGGISAIDRGDIYVNTLVNSTEKWAGFVNPATGHTVGLYAPNADRISTLGIGGIDTYFTPWNAFNFSDGTVDPVVYDYTIYIAYGETIDEVRNTFSAVAVPPLVFSDQPAIQSVLANGAVFAYATADPLADDVASSATSFASVQAIAVFREAAQTIVSAGVSVADTRQLVESVLTTAQATVTANSGLRQVEALLAQINAFPTVQDLVTLAGSAVKPFIFTAQPSISMATGDGGIVAYGTADTGADDVVSTGAAAATVADVLNRIESVLTTIQAVPTVADLLAQVEQVTSAAQTEASVTDLKVTGIGESLLSVASSAAIATDVQLMVDNVTIMARSGASLTEIASYVESAASAATAQATVTDVLLGAFIGKFILMDLCHPRRFGDQVAPRHFLDLSIPRGRA